MGQAVPFGRELDVRGVPSAEAAERTLAEIEQLHREFRSEHDRLQRSHDELSEAHEELLETHEQTRQALANCKCARAPIGSASTMPR